MPGTRIPRKKIPGPPPRPPCEFCARHRAAALAFLEVRVLVGVRVPRAEAYAIQREAARLRSPLMKRPYVRAILW